jgi:hypothetical protein
MNSHPRDGRSILKHKPPKYFFWDISRARKGGYRFKNRIVDSRGLLNEASGGKKTIMAALVNKIVYIVMVTFALQL